MYNILGQKDNELKCPIIFHKMVKYLSFIILYALFVLLEKKIWVYYTCKSSHTVFFIYVLHGIAAFFGNGVVYKDENDANIQEQESQVWVS